MKKIVILLSFTVLLLAVGICGLIHRERQKDSMQETVSADIAYEEKDDETAYEFEISILDELFSEENRRMTEKIERAFDDSSETEAEVSNADWLLLVNFADILGDSYRVGNFPDFSDLYNLDNRMRRENMLLIAAWGYGESLKEEGKLSGCTSRIEVKKAEAQDHNITEITFEIIREERRTYDGGEVTQERKYKCLADIMEADSGPRLICSWIIDPSFSEVRNEIRENGILLETKHAAGSLEKMLQNDREKEHKEERENADGSDETAGYAGPVYDFEVSIQDETFDNVNQRYGIKVGNVLNGQEEHDIYLSEEERKLLAEYAGEFAQTLMTKEYPDLSDVFGSENEMRTENRLLMEAFAYQEAIAFEGTVTECYNEIIIRDVEQLDENVLEVVCEIKQHKNTMEGERSGYSYTGYCCLIDILNAGGKPRMIYCWMDSPGLLMLKDGIVESGILREKKNAAGELKKFVWDRICEK